MSYTLYLVIYYAYHVCTAHTHYIPLQYACYTLLNTLMSVFSMVYKLILHMPEVIPRYTFASKCYTTVYQLVSLLCTPSRTSRPLAQHPLPNNSCLIIRDQYHALMYDCTLCFLCGCTDTGGHFAGAYVPPSVYESVVCCSRS